MDHPPSIRCGAVLLAAGASRRMGQSKVLMRWGDQSVLARIARTFRDAGADPIAAVHAPGDAAVLAELRELGVTPILNPDAPAADMFSSVRCGLTWTGWADSIHHLVIALGDMPAIRPDTLRGLFVFAAAYPGHICQPQQGGRRGHPVVIPRSLVESLLGPPHPHLGAALASHSVHTFVTDDAGIHADIDTPADFHALKSSSRP